MILLKALGKVVRDNRLKKKRTLAQFTADLSLASKRTISDIEHGRRDVKFSTLLKISRGLGMTLAEFNSLIGMELQKSMNELEIKNARRNPLPKVVSSNLQYVDNFKRSLGRAVKDIRLEQHIDLSSLLIAMGSKSNSFASGVESGKKCPRLRTYFLICKALNVKPSQLMKKVEQLIQNDSVNNVRSWSSMQFKKSNQ